VEVIRIYGASDDLIEIDGDIREEFCHPSLSGKWWLACSDGTLFSVRYDGRWRFALESSGSAPFTKLEATENEGSRLDSTPAYSDIITLDAPIRWVVLGRDHARALPQEKP